MLGERGLVARLHGAALLRDGGCGAPDAAVAGVAEAGGVGTVGEHERDLERAGRSSAASRARPCAAAPEISTPTRF
jgi:hypothetical protein